MAAESVDLGWIVAQNVRAERSRRRWRQQDLVDRLGWERASVGYLETGRRVVRVGDLPALARALGMTMLDLCRDADPEHLRVLGQSS